MPVALKAAIVATTCSINCLMNPMPTPVSLPVPVVQQVISTSTATKIVATTKKDPCLSAATFDVGVCGTEKYHDILMAKYHELKSQ